MQNGQTCVAYDSEGFTEPNITVIVGLVIGVGIATLVLIFIGVLGGSVYQQTESQIDSLSGTEANESIGTSNATGFLSETTDFTPVVTSSAVVRCQGVTLASGNYTVTSYGSIVVDSSESFCNATTVYADYSWGDSAIEASLRASITSGFEGIETAGQYLPIVVLAVIIFVVLGLVTSLQFAGGGNANRGYGGYGGVL